VRSLKNSSGDADVRNNFSRNGPAAMNKNTHEIAFTTSSADHQAAAQRRLPLRALFSSLASSRIPTRTSPHLPIPAPQREQVTRLSFVAWSGTANLLLPHFRHLSGASSGMALASILVRLVWDYDLDRCKSFKAVPVLARYCALPKHPLPQE
jgi:hypothetical protein